jgi:hypothetical protein
MNDLPGNAVQPGGDGQIVQRVPHLASRFVARPMLAALEQPLCAHRRMIGGVAVQKDARPKLQHVWMHNQVRPTCGILPEGRHEPPVAIVVAQKMKVALAGDQLIEPWTLRAVARMSRTDQRKSYTLP